MARCLQDQKSPQIALKRFVQLPKVVVLMRVEKIRIWATPPFASFSFCLGSPRLNQGARHWLAGIHECLPSRWSPTLIPGTELKQAGCNCKQGQLTPAGTCTQLQKILFYVQMQMTISSGEHALDCVPFWARGVRGQQSHLAQALRMNYSMLKLSFHSETRLGSRKDAECRTIMFSRDTTPMFLSLSSLQPKDQH